MAQRKYGFAPSLKGRRAERASSSFEIMLSLIPLKPCIYLCSGGNASRAAPSFSRCRTGHDSSFSAPVLLRRFSLCTWGVEIWPERSDYVLDELPTFNGLFDPAAGTMRVVPHSEQRTRLPRTLSGTCRMARQVSLGHSIVTGMAELSPLQ